MRTYTGDLPAPDDGMGLPTIGVPPGAPVALDLRLESAAEGVYVSGAAHARLEGECVRCLDPLTDEITVPIGELFAYPDSVTDETTDEDELPRVDDDYVNLEQTVRDALVLDLPLAPLCRPGNQRAVATVVTSIGLWITLSKCVVGSVPPTTSARSGPVAPGASPPGAMAATNSARD
jgi:uncharacterized metal-binding protein YceD (DUF177 family)